MREKMIAGCQSSEKRIMLFVKLKNYPENGALDGKKKIIAI
jgi:hypothetical protein